MFRFALALIAATAAAAPAWAQSGLMPPNTVQAGPPSGSSSAFGQPRAIVPADLPSGVPANVLRTIVGNDSVQPTDCGKTLQLGTGSTGQFIFTIPSVAGFPASCTVDVWDGDTTRGKLLSGLLALPPVLYPRQAFTIKIVNGVWAVTKQPGRWQIPNAITLFVDPAGSDGNDCLAPGTANACGTPGGALSAAGQGIDEAFQGAGITVQLACSLSYTASGSDMVHYSGRQVGAQGGGAIQVIGCDNTAEDTLLSVTSGSVFSLNTGAIVQIKNLAMATTTSGDCISAADLSKVYVFNVSFHACAGSGMNAQNASVIEIDSDYAIAGGGSRHLNVGPGSEINFLATNVNFTANAAFSLAFAVVQSGRLDYGATINLNAHTITGPRFLVQQGGIAATGSHGNLLFFPGNSDGSIATGGQYDGVTNPSSPNIIGGLGLSNDGGSPNSVLDVASGTAADSTNGFLVTIGGFTKSIAGSWVQGSGANGMGNGLTVAASTWYHVCLAANSGNADVWFDTSAACANRPAGITDTHFRRIGSFRTNGATQITTFSQFGDEFLWSVMVNDVANVGTLGTSAVLQALTVPTGVKVQARYRAIIFDSAAAIGSILLTSPDESDQAPGNLLSSIILDGTSQRASSEYLTRTNTSGQIRYRSNLSSANFSLSIYTFGWLDTRGR